MNTTLTDVDTIVAISTPPGRGGIGIVRLSGPAAVAVAGEVVELSAPLKHARARRARVLDPASRNDSPSGNRTIDEALVTAFIAPRSYTGEDVVEIAAHGSPVILEAIVRAALNHGARLGLHVRLAAPGEFTQRAFLSGRLDLTQAEAVHDLIAAQTLDQARVASQQLGGAISRRVAPAKESLLYIVALLEAGMDFASGELDDVDIVPPAQIAAAIRAVEEPLAALAATFRTGQIRRNGAAIALIGPPNAGKSSLFNRLLERERAIVTALPGTTRDTIEETLALGGIPLRLIDTAGLRGSTPTPTPTLGGPFVTASPSQVGSNPQHPNPPLDEAEQQGIARSREALADADLILLIHDATQILTPTEAELAASIANRPHLVVHNKVDLLALKGLDPLADNFEPAKSPPATPGAQTANPPSELDHKPTRQPLQTSALTGVGLDELRRQILQQLGSAGSLAGTGELNNLRQQEAVTASLTALAAATAANSAHLPHELILLDLHTALQALDSLTGATTADDILARIFSTFCIGK
jgi:tRNA modification GTPase